MIISDGLVWQTNGTFKKKNLFIEGDKIVDKATGMSINAQGYYVIPALIDLHMHGAMGYDFCDGTQEACEKIALYAASQGVLGLCPTTMTYPEEVLKNVFAVCQKSPHPNGASFLGIHMEGPYLSENKCGAQNKAFLEIPSIDQFKAYQALANHQIVRCDIAPELPGAMAFIKALSPDLLMAIGHTEADGQVTKAAIQEGAKHLTHAFNAMKGIHHRSPGPVLAAWESGATIELIGDGYHLDEAVVRMIESLFGIERLIFVSDSMRACGMPDGLYEIGGQAVVKKGNRVTLEDQEDVLAGSATSLMDMLRRVHFDMKIPLGKAVRAVTLNPAQLLGRDDCWGKLETGYLANVLILDRHLNLLKVIKEGKEIPIGESL